MKSIFVDAHTFDENHQGIRTFLKGLYSSMDLENSKVKFYLAASNIDNLKREFANQDQIQFIKLNSNNKYIRLAYEIPKIIKTGNFDYAHFNYYLPLFLNKNCRYIVTIHDVLFIDFPQYFPLKYRLLNTLLFKRSAIKAHILTTVSNYSAERIRVNFRLTKKIEVIPNAVNQEYLIDNDKARDKKYIKERYNIEEFIIFVSRIEPRKNHKTLVKAYSELKLWQRDFTLVLIGSESFVDKELQNMIDEINISFPDRIIRISDVDYLELIKFYNAASLAIFPSYAEGFGIPPLESSVLETPTLCSNTTAMKDFQFLKAYTFCPDDLETLKQKMVSILDNSNISVKHDFKNIASEIKKYYKWDESAKIFKTLILNDKQ